MKTNRKLVVSLVLVAGLLGAGAVSTQATLLMELKAEGNALDSSSNGYNGTWSGTEAYGTGPSGFGQAFSLDGSSKVSVNASSWFPGFDLTVSGWINPSAIGSAQVFLGIAGGWQAFVQTDGKINAAGLVSPGSISANQWTFFTEVIDSTALATRLYLNGALVTSAGYTAPNVAGGQFGIGNYGDTSSYSFPFVGLIDDVHIYDTALTQAQILDVMGAPEPSTVAMLALGGLVLALRRRRA